MLYADREVRLTQKPFPLYPEEVVETSVRKLTVVKKDTALRLCANEDFTDDDDNKILAGDEWLFSGPATYIPRKEVEEIG